MTLGEIMYIEKLASDRDQILYACSAQDNKLLPKVEKNQTSRVASMTSAINTLVARGGY